MNTQPENIVPVPPNAQAQTLNKKVLFVGIVFAVVAIASLVVQNIVSERFNEAQTALSNYQSGPNRSLVQITPAGLFSRDIEAGQTSSYDSDSNQKTTVSIATKTKLLAFGQRMLTDIAAEASFETVLSLEPGKKYVVAIPKKWKDFTLTIDGRTATKNDLGAQMRSKPNDDILFVDAKGNNFSNNSSDKPVVLYEFPKVTHVMEITLKATQEFQGTNSLVFSGVNAKYTIKTNSSDRLAYKGIVNKEESTEGDLKTTSFTLESEENYSCCSNSNVQMNFLSKTDELNKIDRATKYALLIIIVLFAVVFMIDMRKNFVMNVIQYGLMGVSLALFYLFVVATGEYIPFLLAYALGALFTALLNGWYLATVLDNKKSGMVIGGILIAAYTVLYVLLSIETLNFLLGVVILYAILIAFMFLTSRSKTKKNLI